MNLQKKGGYMIATRNIGLLCLSIYLILVGVIGMGGVAVPAIGMHILALAAGVLLLLGK